jgi:hypothetical protein
LIQEINMEQLPKIALSLRAEECLEEMRSSANEGFTSGRVTKTQLVSWIIENFHAAFGPKAIEKIRADHFDEIAHLESVVEQLKRARGSNASLPVHELLTPILQRQRMPPARKDKETT